MTGTASRRLNAYGGHGCHAVLHGSFVGFPHCPRCAWMGLPAARRDARAHRQARQAVGMPAARHAPHAERGRAAHCASRKPVGRVGRLPRKLSTLSKRPVVNVGRRPLAALAGVYQRACGPAARRRYARRAGAKGEPSHAVDFLRGARVLLTNAPCGHAGRNVLCILVEQRELPTAARRAAPFAHLRNGGDANAGDGAGRKPRPA